MTSFELNDSQIKTVIVIEGNCSSGKTYLLQALKNKFGEKNIIFQDLDAINNIVLGGTPSSIVKRKRYEPTYAAIKQLIKSANNEQHIIVISGLAVWERVDLFSNYSLKDESCHLIKYWYQVEPVESLIRYIFRFTKATESAKEIIRKYLYANIETPLNDIKLDNMDVIHLEETAIDQEIQLVKNVINKYRCKEKDTIATLAVSGVLRNGIPRNNIIKLYGYLPATQQEIEQHISELLDKTYVHSAKWDVKNAIDNLPDIFTENYKRELTDLILFVCENYYCDYNIVYSSFDLNNSNPILIFPHIGLKYDLIAKDGRVKSIQKIIDMYNIYILSMNFADSPCAYNKQNNIPVPIHNSSHGVLENKTNSQYEDVTLGKELIEINKSPEARQQKLISNNFSPEFFGLKNQSGDPTELNVARQFEVRPSNSPYSTFKFK